VTISLHVAEQACARNVAKNSPNRANSSLSLDCCLRNIRARRAALRVVPRRKHRSKTMSDIKKDHSVGEGTGAVTGAVTGAAVGTAAGPVGTVVGAIAGGVIGAKAGGAIAEAVNPTAYTEHFKTTYRETPYYNSSRDWNDYEPAYKYGYDTYGQYKGQRFEDVESNLESGWNTTKANSRLAWNEARGAVRDGWHHIERAMPGDADRDGI
jgi:uncharacterized protein YcfJ